MTIRDVGLIGAEKLTGTPLDVGSGAEPDAASRSAIWRHGARSKGEVSRVQWERPRLNQASRKTAVTRHQECPPSPRDATLSLRRREREKLREGAGTRVRPAAESKAPPKSVTSDSLC